MQLSMAVGGGGGELGEEQVHEQVLASAMEWLKEGNLLPEQSPATQLVVQVRDFLQSGLCTRMHAYVAHSPLPLHAALHASQSASSHSFIPSLKPPAHHTIHTCVYS